MSTSARRRLLRDFKRYVRFSILLFLELCNAWLGLNHTTYKILRLKRRRHDASSPRMKKVYLL